MEFRMSEIVCEICGKTFKSTQGLSGHMMLAHGLQAQGKRKARGGRESDRFVELRDFVDLRYKLVMARYLEIEIQRLEQELSRSTLSTQNVQPRATPNNVVVLPYPNTTVQPVMQNVCPICGKVIPIDNEGRRVAQMNQRRGVLVAYSCPHCGAGLHLSGSS